MRNEFPLLVIIYKFFKYFSKLLINNLGNGRKS